MNDSSRHVGGALSDNEQVLRDRLIDFILVVWAVAGSLASPLVLVRAWDMSWTGRDFVQLFVISTVVVIALYRNRLSTHHKAVFLIMLNMAFAVVSVYSLGMLAGSVFLFPLVAVIMALFYSGRTVVVFGLFSMLYLGYVGTGFIGGRIRLIQSADLLLSSPTHWVVYIFCSGAVILIICTTILLYRRAMAKLMAQICRQRDDLEKSNENLSQALNEVKRLSGLLPICASCKKIRDDKGYWNQIELYIKNHSEAEFSHSICPECSERLYPGLVQKNKGL